MADYYSILKRAVAGLSENSREQRQLVYDKARKALLAQLQNMDPPLPPSDISNQRMALEEAVRAVERDIGLALGGKASSENGAGDDSQGHRPGSQVGSDPVSGSHLSGSEAETASDRKGPVLHAPGEVSSSQVVDEKGSDLQQNTGNQDILPGRNDASDKVVRRAGQDVLKNAVRDARALGSATSAAVKSAQASAEIVGDQAEPLQSSRIEPTLGDAVLEESHTYKRSSSNISLPDELDEDHDYDSIEDEKRSPISFGIVASILLLVAVFAGSGYLLYENWDLFLTHDENPSSENDIASSSQEGRSSAYSDEEQSDTSLMPSKTVRTVTVHSSGEEAGSDSSDQDQPVTNPENNVVQGEDVAESQTDQVPAQQEETIAVAQRSILYEEKAAGSKAGSVSLGDAVWSLEGKGDDSVVHVNISIPDRDTRFKISISKNADDELPASHLIEIHTDLGPDDSDRTIKHIPGLILKPTEQSRGMGLVGAAIQISSDVFWVALTDGERERKYNLELLNLRSWIDIPIQFQSGARAILTIEKGNKGDTAIETALKNWGEQVGS